MNDIKIKTPASHRNDPITSYMAEEGINKSGKRFTHQRQITEYVRLYPARTAAEIGVGTGLGQIECSRRLSEINGVTVFRRHRRRCTVNKTMMLSWFILPKQTELTL